MEHLRKLD